MKKTIKTLAILALLAILTIYIFKIPVGIQYHETYVLILSILFTYSVIDVENKFINMKNSMILLTVFGLVAFIFSPVVQSEKYANLVEKKDVNLSHFNTKEEDVRRVTREMAFQVANKFIGSKVNGVQLSSQYELDKDSATVQDVNGKQVWVFPLDYSSFGRWVKNQYTPGFIVVSATNPNAKPELKFDKRIILSKNGYFDNNIERKIWKETGFKRSITHFEIDDDYNPYYISAVLKPNIGIFADGIEFMIITNAESGKSEKLSMEEAKKTYPWIDRFWPRNIIRDRIEYFGKFENNSFIDYLFSGTNVSVPTVYNGSELSLVKANNMLNWFTGMTSDNKNDNSLVSGVMAEATGIGEKPVIHVFEMNQVSDENGAIASIEAKLPARKVSLQVVLPQPYFIDNDFYWTATIISNNRYDSKAYIKGDDISQVSFNSLKKYIPQVGEVLKETKESVYREIQDTMKKLDALLAKYHSM